MSSQPKPPPASTMSREAVWSELYDDSNGLVPKIYKYWDNRNDEPQVEGSRLKFLKNYLRAKELFKQMSTFENNTEDKTKLKDDQGKVSRIAFVIQEHYS
jgi:hypothetical protein